MSLAQHLALSFQMPDYVVRVYLADLTDADLLRRPAPGANHIAWQLGHLISGEHAHFETLSPGSMSALPDGFRERHGKAAASSDDPGHFLTKDEYVRVMGEQRAGTLTLLARMSDEELMQPSPESMRYFGPTVGTIFSGEAGHWMMHSGQWVIVRRMLGKPALF